MTSSRNAEKTDQPLEARTHPESIGQPGCPLCGGKGSVTRTEYLDPPIYLGPDERIYTVVTSVGCECIWTSCPTCGYSYLRDEGHPDCCGYNPYAEVGDV